MGKLEDREMRNAARIILYEFVSTIEGYLQDVKGDKPDDEGDDTQDDTQKDTQDGTETHSPPPPTPVVCSLSTPNLYDAFEEVIVTSSTTSQYQPSHPDKGKDKETAQPEASDRLYLGSRRLLQQTLYDFCRKYYRKNIYVDLPNNRSKLTLFWCLRAFIDFLSAKDARANAWFQKVTAGSTDTSYKIICRGLALLYPLVVVVYRQLEAKISSLRPETDALDGWDLLKDLKSLREHVNAATMAVRQMVQVSPAIKLPYAQSQYKDLVNLMMGCCIMFDESCLRAALRFEDEVFDPDLSVMSLGRIPYGFSKVSPGIQDDDATRLCRLLCEGPIAVGLYTAKSPVRNELDSARSASEEFDIGTLPIPLNPSKNLFSRDVECVGISRLSKSTTGSVRGRQTAGQSEDRSSQRSKKRKQDVDHPPAPSQLHPSAPPSDRPQQFNLPVQPSQASSSRSRQPDPAHMPALSQGPAQRPVRTPMPPQEHATLVQPDVHAANPAQYRGGHQPMFQPDVFAANAGPLQYSRTASLLSQPQFSGLGLPQRHGLVSSHRPPMSPNTMYHSVIEHRSEETFSPGFTGSVMPPQDANVNMRMMQNANMRPPQAFPPPPPNTQLTNTYNRNLTPEVIAQAVSYYLASLEGDGSTSNLAQSSQAGPGNRLPQGGAGYPPQDGTTPGLGLPQHGPAYSQGHPLYNVSQLQPAPGTGVLAPETTFNQPFQQQPLAPGNSSGGQVYGFTQGDITTFEANNGGGPSSGSSNAPWGQSS